MGYHYISIEKNVAVFELYKVLWQAHGISGIRVDTMTGGIKKAVEVEKSVADELYFISIAADDIDFMPQLKILSAETNAPILIAVSKARYSEKEHHEALKSGADFYAPFCDMSENNINAVLSVIEGINQRARKRKAPNRGIIAHGDILIIANNHTAYINDKALALTGAEMKILHYMMINRGNVLGHSQICRNVYDDYDDISCLYSAVKRLRKKIKDVAQADYIETVRDVGYRLITTRRL
jgi:two-component system phosphate regulon response regulator PhoB